jgi:hypothetical protein
MELGHCENSGFVEVPAVTSAQWVMPSESVKDTRHWRLGMFFTIGEQKTNQQEVQLAIAALIRLLLPRVPGAASASPPSWPERIAPSPQRSLRTWSK